MCDVDTYLQRPMNFWLMTFESYSVLFECKIYIIILTTIPNDFFVKVNHIILSNLHIININGYYKYILFILCLVIKKITHEV